MEKQTSKVLYVDFCHTVVSRYTLGWYIRFILFKRLKFLTLLLSRFKLLSFEDTVISAFKELSHEKQNILSQEFSEKLLFFKKTEVINLIKEYKERNFKIVWVSAGMSEYIKKFDEIERIGAEKFITSSLVEKKFNKMYGDNKLKEILIFEESKNISYKAAMSDHISDLPMLEYCDEAIVVSGPNTSLIKEAKKRDWKII